MTKQIVIRLQVGYNHLAIPYTPERAVALADIISNCTAVNVDWNGKTTARDPEDLEIQYVVERMEIPMYAPPMPESETKEETNELED